MVLGLYPYPDNGDFEVVSNMLDKEEAEARGEPHQLAVDNRMVVPVGVPLRIQTTAADVIHSFAVPSLWFKLDAVPGRLNEKMLLHRRARHLLWPVFGTVRRAPWLHADRYRSAADGSVQCMGSAQGGTFAGAEAEEAAPEAAPLQDPESSVPAQPAPRPRCPDRTKNSRS